MSNQMIRNKVKQGPSLVYPNVVVVILVQQVFFLNLRKTKKTVAATAIYFH